MSVWVYVTLVNLYTFSLKIPKKPRILQEEWERVCSLWGRDLQEVSTEDFPFGARIPQFHSSPQFHRFYQTNNPDCKAHIAHDYVILWMAPGAKDWKILLCKLSWTLSGKSSSVIASLFRSSGSIPWEREIKCYQRQNGATVLPLGTQGKPLAAPGKVSFVTIFCCKESSKPRNSHQQ